MEAEMKEMDEKLGKNAFSDDDNFDEAIPIQIRKERTTEAYKEKMNEDIETIDKNDNSKQIVQKTKCSLDPRRSSDLGLSDGLAILD